jgi:hypothetical protein
MNKEKNVNKTLVTAIISSSLIIYVFTNNIYMLDTLPWDSGAPFKHNIGPYLVVFLCIASPYAVISALFGLKEGNLKTAEQTERTIGKIISIEYSGYRINNSPMLKALIKYNDNKKTFYALSEKVQFHFKIGDSVIIYFNPDNIDDAFFDVEESIKEK